MDFASALTKDMNLMLLRHAITSHPTFMCPISGQGLDVRRSVLIDASDYDGTMIVVDGASWDAHKPEVVQVALFARGRNGTDFDVIDGRELHKPNRARK